LLDKGSASINLKSFHYYDRMYPSQDVASSIGNLIALPLQGQALKSGNSAFVDKNWNAYPDQWDILLNHTEKLSLEDIEEHMKKWQTELAEKKGIVSLEALQSRPKPWKKKDGFVKSDVVGKMHIVLGDGIYVDTLNLMPRLQNQIRSMAAFDYPRLDTLMLAAPVSFSSRLEQYIGRLNRDYDGKTEVIVYDYVDSHIRDFDNMYAKRLRTYKRTGFQLMTNSVLLQYSYALWVLKA